MRSLATICVGCFLAVGLGMLGAQTTAEAESYSKVRGTKKS